MVLCSSVEVLEGGSCNLVSWDLSSSAPSLAESGLWCVTGEKRDVWLGLPVGVLSGEISSTSSYLNRPISATAVSVLEWVGRGVGCRLNDEASLS